MFELAQRFCLDLTDTFTGNRELLTNFLKGVVGIHADPETHTQNTFFTRGERCQNARGGFTQVGLDRCIKRLNGVLVRWKSPRWLSSSSPIGVSRRLVPWRFENLAHFSSGLRFFGQFFRVSSTFMQHLARRRTSLLMVSIITGIRIVQTWSAIERVIA